MTDHSTHGARYRVFWPCQDGWLNFVFYGGTAGRRTSEQLVAWMREAGAELGPLAAVDWARFDPTQASQSEVDALEGLVVGKLRAPEHARQHRELASHQHDKAIQSPVAAWKRAMARGVAIVIAATIGDLAGEKVLLHRRRREQGAAFVL